MAISTYAAYKRKVEAAQFNGNFTKASITYNGTSSAFNTHRHASPDNGTAPISVAVRQFTALTAGNLLPRGGVSPLAPPLTAKYWLAQLELQQAVATSRPGAGLVMLVDRLVDLLPAINSATVTPIANTALTGFAPPRFTNGEGVMAALQTVNVIVGSPQISLTYTNQAGTAGQTSKIVATGTAQVLSIIPIPLADGDTGIQSVQSYNVTTAGTSGQFDIVLFKILAVMPFSTTSGVNGGYREMWDSGALQELHPDSNLELWSISQTSSTASGMLIGKLGIIEG